MRLLLKTQIIAIIISILSILLSNLTAAEALTQSPQGAQNTYSITEEPTSNLPTFVPVALNMEENNKLCPEFPEVGATDSMVVCPNGFTPAWWSIRKHRGGTEWRDVGTWETIKVTKALQATGIIKFRIWVTFLGASSPGTCNFEFSWLRNDEVIAQSPVINANLQKDMDPRMLDVQAPLINQSPFEQGDIFKLFIRCAISLDGGRILFGSPEHNTHVEMTCDPIEIVKVTGCQNGIKGLYTDVFKVKYTKLTFIGRVNGKEILEPPPNFGIETIENANYNYVSWNIKLEPGTHDIEIGISYVGNDNTTLVSSIQPLTVKAIEVPTFLGIPLEIWNYIVAIIVLVIILMIIITVYNKHQEKKWLGEMDNS